MNRGLLNWRLGHFQEAQTFLGQATTIAEQSESSNKQLSSQLHLVIAQLAFSQGRVGDAIAESQIAIALDETPTKHTTIAAKSLTGLLKIRSGAKDEGRKTCQEAAHLARNASDPRVLSEAKLSLAEALLESGDSRAALATALEAGERFSQAGQPESEWRAWLFAALANQRLNDSEAARGYVSRARNTLLSLQQRWGAEHFNSYLTRQDIQFYSKQLDQASAALQ
jgi:tetratricopeptide (TPR) repeat protein